MTVATRLEVSAATSAPIGALNAVLVDALKALRAGGQADLGCRLAARAWAVLRHDHPGEARHLERLLHVLALQTNPTTPIPSNTKEP